MRLQAPAIVLERSETALAQVVLDAQECAHSEAERGEDCLPCLVWNDIRESARVRARSAARELPSG